MPLAATVAIFAWAVAMLVKWLGPNSLVGLVFVAEDWVKPAALSAEAMTSLYVSMGVTAAQHLPLASARLGPHGNIAS